MFFLGRPLTVKREWLAPLSNNTVNGSPSTNSVLTGVHSQFLNPTFFCTLCTAGSNVFSTNLVFLLNAELGLTNLTGTGSLSDRFL
jgi:hypothetical protein